MLPCGGIRQVDHPRQGQRGGFQRTGKEKLVIAIFFPTSSRRVKTTTSKFFFFSIESLSGEDIQGGGQGLGDAPEKGVVYGCMDEQLEEARDCIRVRYLDGVCEAEAHHLELILLRRREPRCLW